MPKTYRLPNGKRMPLVYTLPEATACKVGDPRHCQHAEGMRKVGYRDPSVLASDDLSITAVYGQFRLWFAPNLAMVRSISRFDKTSGERAGTVCQLPRPKKCTKIVQRHNPNRKRRRDAGMAKAQADRVFRATRRKQSGRRAHTLKFK